MLDRIKINITLVFAAIALGQAGKLNAADANPPELMTYQGYLVDGNGNALGSKEDPSNPTQRVSSPANYVVVFRIYSAKTQGSAIWAEQQTVTVDKGYFSVLLGQGSQYGSEPNGDLSAVFDGADASDRFIGITVDIAGVANEIEPRLRLLTSPYAYTARQARRLTDGSGNSNFDKVGNSLELGAGSTPTLTLPEAGGASLVGKLTADLPSWGTGLQIDNGSLVTTMGAHNSSLFHFQTGLPQFYFNKGITINGDIRSYLRDTVIGPSNNTDTYLMIGSGSDKITAKADEFLVQGDSKWLKSQFTSSAAELRTNASKFYLDKSLEVEGSLSVDGGISANNLTIFKPDNAEAVLSAYGSSQGTGRLYVGQSTLHGGGIIYNGENQTNYLTDPFNNYNGLDIILSVISSLANSGLTLMTSDNNLSLYFLLITIIGGSLISNTSGIKLTRFYILLKITSLEIIKLVSPNSIINKTIFNTDKKISEDNIKISFLIFISFFLSLFILSSLLVVDNIGFEKSFKLSILTLTNTVNSEIFNMHNLNFSNLLTSSKISLILFMIIGKIELISIFLIFKKILFKD